MNAMLPGLLSMSYVSCTAYDTHSERDTHAHTKVCALWSFGFLFYLCPLVCAMLYLSVKSNVYRVPISILFVALAAFRSMLHVPCLNVSLFAVCIPLSVCRVPVIPSSSSSSTARFTITHTHTHAHLLSSPFRLFLFGFKHFYFIATIIIKVFRGSFTSKHTCIYAFLCEVILHLNY